MNNLSKILIDFNASRDISLFGQIEVNEISDIIAAIEEIIGWLRLEYKRSQWIKQGKTVIHRPLQLPFDLDIEWVKLLIRIIKNNEIVSNYLEVNDNYVNFKTNISEEEKDVIRKDIFDNIKVEPHYYRRFDSVN